MRHNTFIKVRAHIHHCTHQQTTGTAAHGIEMSFGAIAFLDEAFGYINKVVECVFLRQCSTIVIPVTAHFRAAPDMGANKDKSTIHKTDDIR
ncbi:hypothetical protein D3C72_1977070 [compost metagenome]